MKLHCVHERAAEQPQGLEVSDAAHEIGCYTKSSPRKSWPCSSFVKPTSSTQISSAKTSHHICSRNILLFATFLSSQGVKLCVHSGRLGGYEQVKCALPGTPNYPPNVLGTKKVLGEWSDPKEGACRDTVGAPSAAPSLRSTRRGGVLPHACRPGNTELYLVRSFFCMHIRIFHMCSFALTCYMT